MYKTLLSVKSIWDKGMNAGVKKAPRGFPEGEEEEKNVSLIIISD